MQTLRVSGSLVLALGANDFSVALELFSDHAVVADTSRNQWQDKAGIADFLSQLTGPFPSTGPLETLLLCSTQDTGVWIFRRSSGAKERADFTVHDGRVVDVYWYRDGSGLLPNEAVGEYSTLTPAVPTSAAVVGELLLASVVTLVIAQGVSRRRHRVSMPRQNGQLLRALCQWREAAGARQSCNALFDAPTYLHPL
jgi:hypothetical protein